MKRVLVVGGSGFIGTELTHALLGRGYVVTVVDQNPPRVGDMRVTFKRLNVVENGFPKNLLQGIDGVINLTGANIARRWSRAYKEVIRNSRILTTRALVEAISGCDDPPRVLVSASAAGYYGERGEDDVTEGDPAGEDFLAVLAREWEFEAQKAREHGVRVVCIRTAHILGHGGLISGLQGKFRLQPLVWFTSKLHKGDNWIGWTHIQDIVSIYMYALENVHMKGVFNTSAPDEVRQRELVREVAKALKRPFTLGVPAKLIDLYYRGLAQSLTTSTRTNSSKLAKAGYIFKHPNLAATLTDLFGK